jgi:hypothetical protein
MRTVCPDSRGANQGVLCDTPLVLRLLVAGSVTAVVLAPAVSVAPPPAPGPWVQAGAARSTIPGKTSASRGTRLSFFRTVTPSPLRLAVVVRSTSPRPIHLFWWSYCAVLDDDTMEELHQGTVDAVGTVIRYPPVLPAATFCYVSVNVTLPGKGSAVAAVFSSLDP